MNLLASEMLNLTPYAVVIILTAGFSVLTCLYFCYPSLLVYWGIQVYRIAVGMQVKFIGDTNFVFCYGEKGKKRKDKSSILFIHGFAMNKEQWFTAFKSLPKDLHLIALDLPGHGGSSTPPPSQDLSLEYTLESIKRFAELVGLTEQPFHIVGESLGGCFAGLFAAAYPDLVERVTMICPGMKCPVQSEFLRQLDIAIEMGPENVKIEHVSLLPQTTQELRTLFDICVFAEVKLSQQILKGLIDLRLPKNEYYLRVFRSLASNENMSALEKSCDKITMPSQVIWGANDNIVHSSGADVLKKKLPNCQDITIIQQCGHAIELDRPGKLISALLKFRGELPGWRKQI